MSDARLHAEAAKNLAKSFKAVIAMGDYLEKIGTVDEAREEAERTRDAAFKARDLAVASLKDIESKVSDVEARKIESQEYAAVIVANATAQADSIVKRAREDAVTITNQGEAQKAESAELLRGAKADAAKIGATVEAKRTELADLTAKLAVVKQQVAAFVS